MLKTQYLSAPLKTTTTPAGIPYIIGNEMVERFCYYGLRAILVVFMTQYMLNASGKPDHLTDAQAREYYHLFVSAVYFFPFLGAILADVFLGKYRTILLLSMVYCAGPLYLAWDHTRFGMIIGLTLIAIGSGGIKPCVSAHVGDQFGASNQHLLSRVFGWFYFSINFGSTFSTLLIPWMLEHWGPTWAFGLPGVLMMLATFVFWMGRRVFIHIPPGGNAFLRESFSKEGLASVGKLVIIYFFIAIFWSLWDQTASAWVLQAAHLDLNFLGWKPLPSQIQVLNPIFTLSFIPIFNYAIYPAINRVFKLTPLRKIGLGLFLTATCFLIPAWLETQIAAGAKPGLGWQVLAFALITGAEVMVSITGLEFAYTQAPKRMKSLVMSFYLLSVSLGNLFTALVNHFIQNPDGTSKLAGAAYYNFFSVLMLVTAVIFVFVAIRYKEKTYIQDESPATA